MAGQAETLTIRRADITDIETLIAQRRGMFHDMGHRDEAALDAMGGKFRP